MLRSMRNDRAVLNQWRFWNLCQEKKEYVGPVPQVELGTVRVFFHGLC
jgi:hypothetical protein